MTKIRKKKSPRIKLPKTAKGKKARRTILDDLAEAPKKRGRPSKEFLEAQEKANTHVSEALQPKVTKKGATKDGFIHIIKRVNGDIEAYTEDAGSVTALMDYFKKKNPKEKYSLEKQPTIVADFSKKRLTQPKKSAKVVKNKNGI